MPYLSHPVRRIREEPIEGQRVTLRVTVADEGSVDEVADALDERGAVEERLRFRALRVTVDQEAVAAVCELPDLAAVETANTLSMDADGAGEDVDPGT